MSVNDDTGSSWSRSVDVTADESGAISVVFTLPDWFIATYRVTATGAVSGTATATFTDGNVGLHLVSPETASSMLVPFTRFNGAGCSSTASPGTAAVTNGTTQNLGPSGAVSIRVGNPTASGYTFTGWTIGSYTGPAPTSTCIAVTGGSGADLFAHFQSANAAPAVAATDAVVNADEGSTASNGGTWSDANAGDTVSLSASLGTVTTSGSNASGTWSWSFNPTDGPAQTQTVTITASDGTTSTTTTFELDVANVAPTGTIGNSGPINEGSSATISFTSPGDASSIDASSLRYAFDCSGASQAGVTYAAGTATADTSCTFSDNGSHTVTGAMLDKDGARMDAATTVTVNNVAPALTAAAHQTGDEGSATSFSLGSFTDAGANDNPWAVEVNWGDGSGHTTFDQATAGPLDATTHAYDDDGTYTVHLTVTDKDGGTDTTSFTVTVANVAPIVHLTGDDTLDEGTTHAYSFTISDPGNDTFAFAAGSPDCGIGGILVGTPDPASGAFSCRFPDGPATPTVGIQVNDGTDDSVLATVDVSVQNVAPRVVLTGDANVDEGSTHTYSFAVTDQGDDTFVASAGNPDCDGGATTNGELVAGSYAADASGGIFECVFADGPATANVKMKVEDSDGDSGTDSESVQVVTVHNVAPVISAPSNQTADEGASTSFDLGSFADPGGDAPWAVAVSWGDGSPDTTFDQASPAALDGMSHAYDDSGSYTVGVTVTDKDGESDTKSFDVAVANVAPTATFGNSGPVDEGADFGLWLTAPSDPSSADASAGFTYAFDCGSGYGIFSAAATAGCATTDNGTRTVRGKIRDKDGGTTAYAATVTITNVAPHITSFTGTTTYVGPLASMPSTFTTAFTDPGTADSWAALFGWSDGTPLTQSVNGFATGQSVTHMFTSPSCTKTVSLTVTDDDDGFDTATATVKVGTAAFLAPLTNQPVTNKLKNGQVLPVKIQITDCTGAPVTGLQPAIRLMEGDQTAVADDSAAVITVPASVSAADTSGIMRASDGGSYIYNMSINLARLSADYTIVVYPFGTGAPTQTLRHVIQATK